jgi:chitin synthase
MMPSQKTSNVLMLRPAQQQEQTEYEVFVARWQTALRQTAILTCITLYNENGNELLRSLVGLAENIEYLTSQSAHLRTGMFPVCVIVDGYSSISPTMLKYAKRLKLISQQAAHQNNHMDTRLLQNGMTIFEAEISSTEIFALATEVAAEMNISATEFLRREGLQQGRQVFPAAQDEIEVSFPVLFCIKAENAGKLDSHWWFFRQLCPIIQPEYCIQMDVGTVANRDTLAKLWSVMESDLNCAVAVPSILTPPPSSPWQLLQGWQYADFVWERAIHQSVQAQCGYLEVLAGQFCIFRYQALLPAVKQTTDLYSSSSTSLDRYFRGLQVLSPLETNMFLAEDRVLGFEVIAQQNAATKIKFIPDAIAITDRCQSLEELMRQRRRWLNSGNIAKIWALFQLRRYWQSSNSPLTTKITITLAIFWNALCFPAVWFLPVFNLGILLNLAMKSQEIFADHAAWGIVSQGGAIVFFILWLVQFWISSELKRDVQWQKQILKLSLFLQFTIAIALLIVTLLFGQPATAIGVATCIAGTILTVGFALVTVGIFSSSTLKRMIPATIIEIFFSPIMQGLLSMYAIMNLHDCSWGTKGLHHHDAKTGGGRKKIVLSWMQLERVIVSVFLVLLVSSVMWPASDQIKVALFGLCSLLVLKIVFNVARAPFVNSRRRKFLRFRSNVVSLWLLTNGVLLFGITMKGSLADCLALGVYLMFILRFIMGTAFGCYYILKTRKDLDCLSIN